MQKLTIVLWTISKKQESSVLFYFYLSKQVYVQADIIFSAQPTAHHQFTFDLWNKHICSHKQLYGPVSASLANSTQVKYRQ